MPLLRPLLSSLPAPIASSLCYRLFAHHAPRFAAYFDDAPLRYAPQYSMKLRCGDWAHISIAFTGVYEQALTNFIRRRARTSESLLFVDVGANYGYFSLLWAALNPAHRVVAYEPATATGQALAHNIARNHLNDRIRVVPKAAGPARQRVAFEENSAQTGWSRVVDAGPATREVEMVRLDDEFPPDATIEFLKVDAEGHDWGVLDGALGLFQSRRVRTAIFECDQAEYAGDEGEKWTRIARTTGYALAPFERSRHHTGLMQCLLDRRD